ncbi:MAG: glycosyltransferase family 9 protein [Acidobacteriota bacterium]
MSALGDIVHALPVLSALGSAHPQVEIDWLVDRPYAGVLDLVEGVSRRVIGRPGLLRALRELRPRAYDVALDLQGLLKSAGMARLSGAARVIGFETRALREPAARWLYSEQCAVSPSMHVVKKNLAMLTALGVRAPVRPEFPFLRSESRVADHVVQDARAHGDGGFALLNPGAAWPNKRWPPSRFGRLAGVLRDRHGMPSYVLWGEGEDVLADAVVSLSDGAARRAPRTSLADLLALFRQATLIVSGDTGPLHLAAAMSTPIVGLYGPTWPERNGPWSPDDEVVSRAAQCGCHHKRRCRRDGSSEGVEQRMCLADISVDEVAAAVSRRLARGAGDGQVAGADRDPHRAEPGS